MRGQRWTNVNEFGLWLHREMAPGNVFDIDAREAADISYNSMRYGTGAGAWEEALMGQLIGSAHGCWRIEKPPLDKIIRITRLAEGRA